MKYAYKNKDNRKTITKVSTRRRKPKTYNIVRFRALEDTS